MLFQGDDDEDGHPVAHQRQEVLKDVIEVVAATQSTRGVDDGADTRKNPSRDSCAVSTEYLEAQGCGIRAGDVVCDEAEGNEDAEKLSETSQALVSFKNESSRRHFVGGAPRWLSKGSGCKTDAQEIGETHGKAHAGGRHGECLPLFGVFGVVDVKVGSCGGPGNRR